MLKMFIYSNDVVNPNLSFTILLELLKESHSVICSTSLLVVI
jgi:hypothetical protein